MPGSQSSGGQKPVWFEGQKELGNALFSPGGPFRSLLGGGPDAGYEAGVSRGQQALNQNLAQQGLAGSNLAARAAVNFQAQAAQGREQNRLGNLLNAVQPAGTSGRSSSGSGLGKLFSM